MRRASYICAIAGGLLGLVAATILASAAETTDVDTPPFKLAERSGLCHARGTSAYNMTKHFRSFATLEECEAASRAMRPQKEPQHDRKKPAPIEYVPRENDHYSLLDWRSMVPWLLSALGLAAIAYWWHWYTRQRTRHKLRELERQAEKRWRGHRRDPPKP